MKKILQEEILRIKSMMMINEKKVPYRDFVKKHGFKLECSSCDSSPNYDKYSIKRNLSYTERDSMPDEISGEWHTYYLIINNKNSCSGFPLMVADYDKSAASLSSPVDVVGDALIVARFNLETQIIEDANVLLCDKLYTKEKYLNFKEVFKSNLNQDYINIANNYNQDGSYWIMLKNLTYQKMEEIINWVNTGHQILSQNLIKKDKDDTLDIT